MSEKLRRLAPEPPAEPSEADRIRLERMFAAYHVIVWRTLRRRGLSPDAAADATQESFLVAAHRLSDIEPDRERAFLVGTALRVAHTLRRKTARWALEEDMDHRLSEDNQTDGADLDLCDLALSRVAPELAEVFILYEIEGLSSPEIAALLEIPLGTVASRLRRAREQFRAVAARIERSIRAGVRS